MSYSLLAMIYDDFNTVFPVEMLGEMLCAVDRPMLTAGASEREHQVGEPALKITLHMMIGKLINGFEKFKNLAIVFEEPYYGFV